MGWTDGRLSLDGAIYRAPYGANKCLYFLRLLGFERLVGVDNIAVDELACLGWRENLTNLILAISAR